MEKSVFHRPRQMLVYRERSVSLAKLIPQLCKAQAEFAPIVKDSEGCVLRRDSNGRLKEEKYRYASLESMYRGTKPALLKHQILPTQEFCLSDEGVTLITCLTYGDEFVSSVLPIRQYDNQDQQIGHVKRMRRMAYASLLCLAVEDEPSLDDEAPAVEEPAAEGESAQQAKPDEMWRQQERLALKALEEADTPASVETILSKVRKKIAGMDMDPHCLGRMESAGETRLVELRKKAKSNGKPVAEVAT
jgi:hypothetical protein